MFKKLFYVLICLNTSFVFAKAMTPKDIENRMQSFSIPKEMEIKLWADPTLTKNPSFFSFDSQGRMMIAEIYRVNKGVADVRTYSKELNIADIYNETNDDRFKMYHHFKDQIPENQFSKVSDKIRIVEDTNFNGKADKATLYADGFNDLLDGLGSGVLERNGKVYYTNIPHLWQLEDQNNDGVSDKRTSLQDGFGTRVSFMGHDMHGLAWGPEGRLYWSIGDRGYSFTNKEGKKIHGPNLGAVFRAHPDGSNLEVFYTGLRNPQELVFDEYGNLFTADNDGDNGDFERINHLIEGGESGWHAGHQSLMSFTKKFELRSSKYTGEDAIPQTWLVNDMSLPRNDNQPQFILPSIGQLFTGPSGMTYNPSNYLGEEWRNSFFVANYGGSPAGSYIISFKTVENGASFLSKDIKEIIRGLNVTDIDFGPDGKFYISEFNFGGWEPKDEGAIYSLSSNSVTKKQTKIHKEYYKILTSDFSQKSLKELAQLLSIDHQTIRQRAQFAMADRGQVAFDHFKEIALNYTGNTLSRVHSLWGISQLALNNQIDAAQLAQFITLFNDPNEKVRIQLARILGSHPATFAESALIKALNDKHNKVAMYAAYALGNIHSKFAVKSIIAKLETIKDSDLWLRHALTMALKNIDKKHWLTYKNHNSMHVRLGILLTLRSLADNDVSFFLQDKNKTLVDEAITAIDDKSLVKSRAKVAALLDATMLSNTPVQAYIHHRIINANFNEGQKVNIERLLKYSAHPDLPDRLAAEALAAIEGWNDINPIDTITGLPTQANTNRKNITALIYQYIPKILAETNDKALVQAMRLAGQVNYVLPSALLQKIAKNPEANLLIREQALKLLDTNFNSSVLAIAKSMLKEKSPKVKSIALAMIFKNDEAFGLTIAEKYLSSKDTQDQKIALALLEKRSTLKINKQLVEKLLQLTQNKHQPEITLELLATAEKSSDPSVQKLLNTYNEKMNKSDLLTQFSSTLHGGDAEQGKALVFGGDAAQCIRCHIVGDKGSRVGPNLSDVGNMYNSDYLLEALIDPNAAIAPGYGSMTLTMKNKKMISGLFFSEDQKTITIGKDELSKKSYQKNSIKHIQRPVSGMPPMRYILKKGEVRDILAYLQTLQETPEAKGH